MRKIYRVMLPVLLLVVSIPRLTYAETTLYKLAFLIRRGENNGYQLQTVDTTGHLDVLLDLPNAGKNVILAPGAKSVAYREFAKNDSSLKVQTLSGRLYQFAPDKDANHEFLSFSPDAQYVAVQDHLQYPTTATVYMEDETEFIDPTLIYNLNDLNNPIKIIQMGFDWSPDSMQLVYATTLPYHLNEISTIKLRNPSDLQERQLLTIPITYFHTPEFRWSPDGKRIAFIAELPRPLYDAKTTSHQQLYVMNLDTPVPILMVEPEGTMSAPVWSPDSKQIAFTLDNTPGINLIRLDGAYLGNPQTYRIQQITHLPAKDLTWSANGEKLAFISKTDQGDAVYIVNTGGGDPKSLTLVQGYAGGLTWINP